MFLSTLLDYWLDQSISNFNLFIIILSSMYLLIILAIFYIEHKKLLPVYNYKFASLLFSIQIIFSTIFVMQEYDHLIHFKQLYLFYQGLFLSLTIIGFLIWLRIKSIDKSIS